MGGGGKGGGGGHTPIEKPNTLESAQRLKVIDLLCEGVAGQDVTFKNIYLDNTPIQNADGSYNFTGIRVSALPGTHNQDYLAGFDSTDKIVSVGTEVKAATPITRTVTDPLVDSVRVTLALGSLVTMKDNGDRVGGSVSLTVICGNKSYPVTISGKTTSAYHQDVTLTDLPDTPFNISVQRNTSDSTTDKTSNATHWVSYVESIDAKFNYPNSVVVGLEIDSAQFGGKIPTRTYRNQWTQIKVPSNYDPITRTYEGVWLGEFKIAWSNNPAWVFYDLVTDKRYGLGDRLGEFGCDKWSLYQIAKYCDQIVPDGFGGHEPRFTCNAYLSEPRDAKSLLDDLASVFRGIAVWDGQMVTALQDAKKDPTATYSNSNVVDGLFAYSGAAQKTIFTAVHVKYNDKTDSYTTKTEYVADDEAIKRYGLNVKQITAFGCTSRGQAARVGKWLIETSIRERQMVSFSVGREGIRHLPFDIIEIADNDYAGDMIGGRVLSVLGNAITVDRIMSNVSSIRYYANGQSKTVNVTAVQDNKITLSDTPVGIEQLGVFSATKTDVKPRLFRALSIKEDDGTYTISAVQHAENKEAIVDQGATFEQDDTATKHKPQVSYGRVSKDGDELVVSWEGTNAVQYLIKIYKDGKLYKSYTQETAEIKLKGLSNGEYRAEIRGKSANGELTEAVIKEWVIDYDINGLKATPELFAIKLDWTNPTTVINKAKIEIYSSQTADRATASKVATLSYPTDTFTQNGVKLTEMHHFWLRLIDDQGNTGNWVTISGQCSSDTSQIVESINGQITETELAQSLIDSLQNDVDTAKDQAIASASTDAAKQVAAEATARANALQAEANARTKAIAAQDKKHTDALITKADELGTQISEVSNTTDQQARKLTTITAAQGDLVSGLEKERTARINGDAAEAEARQTLVSDIKGNKTSITDLQSTKASKTEVSSLARTALQSEWKDYADDKIDGLEVGGRNLLLSSKINEVVKSETATFNYARYFLTELLVVGKSYTFKADIKITAGGFNQLSVYVYDGGLRYDNIPIIDGQVAFTFTATSALPNSVLVYAGPAGNTANRGILITNAKLEKGNKATDWTPAPEDVTADIKIVSSELTSFKQTTASKDQAQTIVNNQALSRINDAESKITSLQSTKASKNEVSSLARTVLQSEWQNAADTAKDQAVAASKASIDSLSQTLSDKDKSLTASLVKIESDVAGNKSSISEMRTTIADNTQSIAQTKTDLRSEFVESSKVKDTRDKNETPQWYWDNYPAQTAKEFKLASAVDITANGAYVYVETLVKWKDSSGGAIIQMAYDNNGDVYSRKSTSSTKWGEWVKQEDVVGSAAKVKALKDFIEPKITANTAEIAETKVTLANANEAIARVRKDLTADFNNIRIGGRNLLKDSGTSVTTSAYNVQDYPLVDTLVEGEIVTVTVWGTLGSGKEYFAAYNSGGRNGNRLSTVAPNVHRATFPWTVDYSNTFLRIYHMPSSNSVNSTIDRVKLERGNTATDWSETDTLGYEEANRDRNLYNYPTCDLGRYLNSSGVQSALSAHACSSYIEVKAGTTITISIDVIYGTFGNLRTAFYDVNKNFLVYAFHGSPNSKTLVVPSNAKYLRFSSEYTPDRHTKWVVALGSEPLPWTPSVMSAGALIAEESVARASAVDAVASSISTLQSKVATGTTINTYNMRMDWSQWTNYSGSGELTTSSANGMMIGNNSGNDQRWMIRNENIPVIEGAVYRVTVRYWNKAGSGRTYIGVAGVHNNGTSLVNNSGSDSYSNQVYVGIDSAISSGWVEMSGLFAASGTNINGLTGVSELHPAAKYFRPLLILNYSNEAGITYVDYFKVEIVDKVNIASIQESKKTTDGLKSQYSIKTQVIAGGKRALAGIAIGAAVNEGTAESQVIVMADKFGVVKDAGDSNVKPMLTVVNNQVAVNGDLIADGTILGKHIKANQTLTAPIINGGELNINNRFKVDKFGNTTIQSNTGNTGLKITDERIEVYNNNGTLRVRFGVW